MSRLRSLSIAVLVAIGMLVLLAGPAAAATPHVGTLEMTCGGESLTATINLRSNSVVAHVDGSTSRSVGFAFEGEIFEGGTSIDTFAFATGRGPSGRVESCGYTTSFTLPDGRARTVVGTVHTMFTPARR
jgi:hypothetical protein